MSGFLKVEGNARVQNKTGGRKWEEEKWQDVIQAWASPLHVHRGHVELDSFQPQHHEETLREGTVADALTVAARLQRISRFSIKSANWGRFE